MTEATSIPLGWAIAILVSAGTFTAFLFSTFKTKADAEKDLDRVMERLDSLDENFNERMERMEDKIDRGFRA